MDVSKIRGTQPPHRPGPPPSKAGDKVRESGTDVPRSAPASPTAGGDVANLSTSAADFRSAVDALADRAQHGEDRTEIVEAARARLESGDLGSAEVFDAVARRILAS